MSVKPISLAEKKAEPVEGILDRLRTLYAQAKSGKIRALRYVTLSDDGRYAHGSAHDDLTYHESNTFDLGTLQLAHRMKMEVYEREGDADDEDEQADPSEESDEVADEADELEEPEEAASPEPESE